MAKTREFLLLWDSIMANPNGDMLSDNRPRQDEKTGQLEVSPCRIKRYVKDDWKAHGLNVFTTTEEDEKGNILTCKAMAKKVMKDLGVKDAELEAKLLADFIDVKLFGCVVTDPNIKKTGTLQVAWTKSIHEAEVKFVRGNSAFASGEGKDNTTFSDHYISPYALFTTYMVYNDMMAKNQGIDVSEEDIEAFKTSLIRGMKTYKSHSKNQMPRLLVEVIYKETCIDGELNYVDVVPENGDLADIRNISDVIVCLDKLKEYYELNKDVIEKVVIHKHMSVKLESEPEEFEYEVLK